MYFITVLKEEGNCRCVGYYSKFEDAELSVLKNNCDISDSGYYQYACIENISEGIYRVDLEPNWYKWDNDKSIFERCSKPEKFTGMVAFSIG